MVALAVILVAVLVVTGFGLYVLSKDAQDAQAARDAYYMEKLRLEDELVAAKKELAYISERFRVRGEAIEEFQQAVAEMNGKLDSAEEAYEEMHQELAELRSKLQATLSKRRSKEWVKLVEDLLR